MMNSSFKKTIILFGVVIVVIFICFYFRGTINNNTEDKNDYCYNVAQENNNAVVTLSMGKDVYATGVIISYQDEKYVLSVGHIFDEKTDKIYAESNNKQYTCKLYRQSAKYDLAILEIENCSIEPIEIVNNTCILGETVVAYGNSLNNGISLKTGIVSKFDAVIDDTKTKFVQASVPINEGDSGAPVFNMQGKMLGVFVGKIESAYVEGMSYFIKMGDVIDFLRTV